MFFFFPQLCVSEEGTRWSKYFFPFHVCLYSNIKPSRADPPCHGRSTVPSSLSPVVNIHSLIHPVQCQQFKRAQFVFLSTSISVIPLWVARSHFRTWVPSKGLNTWGFQNVSAGMTQYFARVVQCNKTNFKILTTADNFFTSCGEIVCWADHLKGFPRNREWFLNTNGTIIVLIFFFS